MNINNIDYIDGLNKFGFEDYIDNIINFNLTSSNIFLNDNSKLNNSFYYDLNSNLIICNSNTLKEIRFKTSGSYPQDNSKTGTIIDFTGKLQVYHNYNLLQPTFPAGYYDVENEILQLKADGINTDLQFTGIEGSIIYLQDEITALQGSLINVGNATFALKECIFEASNFKHLEQLATNSTINFVQAEERFVSLIGGLRERAERLYTNSIIIGSIGGLALGLVGGAISAVATQINYEYASNILINNCNLTNTEKSNIYSTNYSNQIDNYSNFNVTMSNLNIQNGFINSNILTNYLSSYLPLSGGELSGALSLNGNNITNINNLNASTATVTSISTTKLANVSPPSVGFFGSIGDKIILYPGQNNSSYCYSIGINTNSLWNSIPLGSFDWYINGAINLSLSANTLNVIGNLQENSVNLSTIYTTNTNLNTTINNINNTLNLVYTAEKQYPPKLYDTVTDEVSTIYNGINCYITTFTINPYINGYGIGNYTIYSSSFYTVQTGKKLLFNYNSAEVGAHFGNEYDANGLYIKSNYIKPDFLGDWIIIKLPNPIIMTKFRFYNRATLTRRSPGIWKLYGSNDGINFIEIVEGHNIVSRLIITDYTGLGLGYYEKVLASSFTSTFLYYGWTINKLVGSDNVLNFSELQIYGKELLNPIYNYISSNVLSNNLLNYLPLTGGTINGNLTATNFIQNGNFLDTIYTNNTNLNTIINSINNDITALYTIEKQYPPKTYDTTTTETATIYNGINCFTTSFNINTYINGYSIGEYITYASTSYSSTTGKNLLFNYNTADAEGAHWALNQYSSSGIYIGNNYIKNNYLGEWVIIKLPYKILLTRFRFYVRSPFTIRAPGEWRFYGSNDGITFTEITEAHNLTRLTATSYSIGYYEQILANTFTTPYLYFGITVNKLVGNDTVLNFNEFQIFGKELLNPLINYTTSNVAQNLIIGNENIQKKYSFNFTCSTPITISSTIYYKYDIDLRNYTKTKASANPQSPYRIFNIRLFLSSVYFEVMVNNTYNILNYEVYMSNEINAGSYGGQIGINIVANHIGNTPANPLLVNILPSYFTLLRTADFNYLSVISTIQNANLNCIIQDILY